MFTGIVEELAEIREISQNEASVRFVVQAGTVVDGMQIGDSIAVNGVCLTVVKFSDEEFHLDLVPETLRCSNLGDLIVGSKINVERPVALHTRLGGHMVQGHVECTARVSEIKVLGDTVEMSFELPANVMRYVILKGSITLDGVSLTVASIDGNIITIALIPHTLAVTTLGIREVGQRVNVETDIIGKYIESLFGLENEAMSLDMDRIRKVISGQG